MRFSCLVQRVHPRIFSSQSREFLCSATIINTAFEKTLRVIINHLHENAAAVFYETDQSSSLSPKGALLSCILTNGSWVHCKLKVDLLKKHREAGASPSIYLVFFNVYHFAAVLWEDSRNNEPLCVWNSGVFGNTERHLQRQTFRLDSKKTSQCLLFKASFSIFIFCTIECFTVLVGVAVLNCAVYTPQ